MRTAILTRHSSGDDGTFGVLSLWKLAFYTGELPWRANKPELSCIPAGIYTCTLKYSPHFKKDRYHLENVPGRSDIMIHPANFMGDTRRGYLAEVKGCISVGKFFSTINGQKAILKTDDAVKSLENFLNGEDFILEIQNAKTIDYTEIWPVPY